MIDNCITNPVSLTAGVTNRPAILCERRPRRRVLPVVRSRPSEVRLPSLALLTGGRRHQLSGCHPLSTHSPFDTRVTVASDTCHAGSSP
jgi:hypothetical protein